MLLYNRVCRKQKITNQNKNANWISKKYELAKKYNHDIRNIKSLDNEMIDAIRDMSNENKIDIIISFNTVLKYLKIMLDI